MVKYSDDRLDLIFKALSDPTRRGMLSRLARNEMSVTELAEPYDMSLAAVSKHLRVLEDAQFIERTKQGRVFRCRANLAPLAEVTQLLEDLGQFWRDRLDALDQFLANEKSSEGERHASKRKK